MTLAVIVVPIFDNNISISDVTTFSPNATKIDNVDLNNDDREFLPFNTNSEYVLTSTVFNLSDSEIELTEKNYTLIKSFSKNRIQVGILLRK